MLPKLQKDPPLSISTETGGYTSTCGQSSLLEPFPFSLLFAVKSFWASDLGMHPYPINLLSASKTRSGFVRISAQWTRENGLVMRHVHKWHLLLLFLLGCGSDQRQSTICVACSLHRLQKTSYDRQSVNTESPVPAWMLW